MRAVILLIALLAWPLADTQLLPTPAGPPATLKATETPWPTPTPILLPMQVVPDGSTLEVPAK